MGEEIDNAKAMIEREHLPKMEEYIGQKMGEQITKQFKEHKQELINENKAANYGDQRARWERETYVSEKLNKEEIKFSNTTNHLHPVEFIDRLEGRFKMYHISGEERLNLALQCCTGNVKEWLRENDFRSYQEFKTSFFERYWNQFEQNKLLKQIYNGSYQSKGTGSMSGYFRRLVKQAAYLNCPIPEAALVRQLITHFKEEVKILLVQAGDNTEEVIRIIKRLEGENVSFMHDETTGGYSKGPQNNRDNTTNRYSQSRWQRDRGNDGRGDWRVNTTPFSRHNNEEVTTPGTSN